MSTYEVLASVLTTSAGRYRLGANVELSAAEAERMLKLGAVRVPGDDSDAEAESYDDDGGEAARPPAQSEPKAAFVDYVVEHMGVEQEQAEAMSKAELVDLTRQD